MVYNRLKETKLHRKMKWWLRQSLRADSNVPRESISVERRFSAKLPDKSYRRPDVSAEYRGVAFVFEVQLASTFVKVVAERRAFYEREGAKLIWVFNTWPIVPEKFTHKDIYYTNNFNVFVVNEDTVKRSKKDGRFICEVWWATPDKINEDGHPREWQRNFISLADLRFDGHDGGRAYYKDVDSERAAYKRDLKSTSDETAKPLTVASVRESEIARLRGWFLELQHNPGSQVDNRLRVELMSFINNDTYDWLAFATAACEAYLFAADLCIWSQELDARAIFCALLSLEEGKALRKWKNLKEIENHIFNSYPKHYALFLHAAKEYGREKALDVDNLASTCNRHKELFKASPIRDQQERRYDALIEALFPRLAERLARLRRNNYDRTGIPR